MLDCYPKRNQLPAAPGVGYKPVHFSEIIKSDSPVEWLEIHAENYMGDGGRPLAQIRTLSERYKISIHGVALSIGGEDPLDTEHLSRLKKLLEWIKPSSFSEHLAWSTHGLEYINDLLPLPYTNTTLDRIVGHINQVQETLGYQMLLENPSTYLAFEESDWAETEFLAEIGRRSGCGLLLDLNNVFVSATNMGFLCDDYLDDFPLDYVGEIHLAGYEEDQDDHGQTLLIDSHKCPVADTVWRLLDKTLEKTGPKPVLVEWDNDVPAWSVLAAEARRAAHALSVVTV
ncbi:MAG: DUF692 domain-containing protein [Aestuariivita sp.]|nr:DUF692 domain-containing protein [Aestuariivita sp.]